MSFKQSETPKVGTNSFLSVATSKTKPGPSVPSVFGNPFSFNEDYGDSSCNSSVISNSSIVPLKRKQNMISRIVPDTYTTDTQATTQFDGDDCDEESQREFFSADLSDNDTGSQVDFHAPVVAEEVPPTTAASVTTQSHQKGRTPQSRGYLAAENEALLDGVAKYSACDDTHPAWSDVCKYARTKSAIVSRSDSQYYDHLKVMQVAVRSSYSACNGQGLVRPVAHGKDAIDKQNWLTYVTAMYEMMIKDPKNYQSAKWWTYKVVSKTLQVIQYRDRQIAAQVGAGVTTTADEIKGKLNQELEARRLLVREQKQREDEKEERKMQNQTRIADVAAEMAVSLRAVTAALLNGDNHNTAIDLTHLEEEMNAKFDAINGKLNAVLERLNERK
jgi:hypothetical protein